MISLTNPDANGNTTYIQVWTTGQYGYPTNLVSGVNVRLNSQAYNSANVGQSASVSPSVAPPLPLAAIRSQASGTLASVFVNGTQYNSTGYSATLFSSPFALTIGGIYSNGAAYNLTGYISECGVINQVPSVSDGSIYDLNTAAFYGISGVSK